jgi:hypothetical protein
MTVVRYFPESLLRYPPGSVTVSMLHQAFTCCAHSPNHPGVHVGTVCALAAGMIEDPPQPAKQTSMMQILMGKWQKIGIGAFAVWMLIAVIGSTFDTAQRFDFDSTYIQFMLVKAAVIVVAAVIFGMLR